MTEQGRRLHGIPAPRLLWLELLLRQHEACWTADEPHERLRVFFYGGDAVNGDGERAENSVTEHCNGYWKSMDLPAHAFNLGFVAAHAVKDTLIVRESLRYRPDVIVYGVHPADFTRWLAVRPRAPGRRSFDPIVRFMRNSASALRSFAAERPAGLERPLDEYSRRLAAFERRWNRPLTWPVGEVTTFVFTALATRLGPLGERLGLVQPFGGPTWGVGGPYRCRDVRKRNARDYRAWGDVNSLAYLAEVRDRTGIPVVVVDLPLTHEPSEGCYNSYFTKRLVSGYRAWIREEAQRLALPLINLSETLLPRDFHDPLHPNARGLRKTAGALSAHLVPMLRRRVAEALPVEPH